MTIMLVGGGSGGHITPLLAIAKHLSGKNYGPSGDIRIIAVTERGGKFASLFKDNQIIDDLYFIFAGKLRRFHGESWFTRATDVKRNLLNLRDSLRLILGFMQCIWLLIRKRPQIIFIKGGYVGVPIGLAAWLLRIPYMTHDSDALAGLSNRLIARGAKVHAVGMAKQLYGYPAEKIVTTGIPVDTDFHSLTEVQVKHAKVKLGIPETAKVLMITGGSNGAERLNKAIQQVVKVLIEQSDELWVIHQFGQGNNTTYENYPNNLRGRIIAESFLIPLSDYSAAADLIITRAGATTLAEFAAQSKACVVVPNPYLTGGHQLHNADALRELNAIIMLSEKDMTDKSAVIKLLANLLNDAEARVILARNLESAMPSNAAEKLANLLVKTAKAERIDA